MNWKTIKDVAWFGLIMLLAIVLIENEGGSWMVETAGDLFGAFGLMALAIYRTLRDD